MALIRSGRLIAVSRIDELRRQLQRRVTLQLGPSVSSEVEGRLRALPSVGGLAYHDGRWHFALSELAPLLQLLATLPVQDVTIEPPSLADVFLHLYHSETQSG